MKRVVVLGGGISGLATAYRLRGRARARGLPLELRLVEAAPRPGGKVQTLREDDFVCEAGPQGFLDNEPATLRLVDDLGLGSRLLRSNEAAARRFIYHRGDFHELSMDPLRFLMSPLLSVRGKLAVAAEFFRPPRRDGVEETVREFGVRRLGKEFTDVLLDAMVSGIHAGDIQRLSLPAAFPRIAALEAEHGGLFRGMIAKRKAAGRGAKKTHRAVEAGPGGVLHSFDAGMQVAVDALATELGDEVLILGRRAVRMEPHEGGYRLFLKDSHAAASTLDADAVVLALPAPRMADVLATMAPAASVALGAVPVAGVHVVCLGYDAHQVGNDVRGFGTLIPRQEGLRTLGVLYVHATFTGHAPEGRVLLRAMLGGRHDPGANRLGDEELVALVRGEIEARLRIDGAPSFVRCFRWNEGIPQYELGHLDRVARARKDLAAHPGVFLTGNSICGIAFNACVAHSEEVAREVVGYLGDLETAMG